MFYWIIRLPSSICGLAPFNHCYQLAWNYYHQLTELGICLVVNTLYQEIMVYEEPLTSYRLA